MQRRLTVRTVSRIGEIRRESWDRLVNDGTPFVKWDWLDSLEQTGCVSEKSGWLPHHIIVEEAGQLTAACPMYLKWHSMGEFVFDHEWAGTASQAGIAYYPKMLVGVPFTPVTGPRFLTDPNEDRNSLTLLMGQALIRICRENKLSSAHVNFCLGDEAAVLTQLGFLPRSGLQFHWQNHGYQTFDDYLASFRSDRRNKIKRERRELARQGITIRAVQEDDLTPELMRTMFQLYKGHIDKMYYGHQYLNREFFEQVLHRLKPYLCLILAEKNSRIIAGTFNVQDKQALYGRYWGACEEIPYLHFNVCYYAAIEHCIRKKLRRFEAGAGGSFKYLRGLEPDKTRSMHYIRDERLRQALQQHLKEERAYTDAKQEALLEKSPLKKRET